MRSCASTWKKKRKLRIWETEQTQGPQIGVVLPEDNVVFVRELSRNARGRPGWPNLGALQIGSGWGVGDGQMKVPISFDVGPQGRIYVLDADNARIQVFDAAGNYLTQWGSEGSGPGQFIFRRDGDTRAGSVAVDEDGFIYVADVGNKRIQKFAP
jgi:tripartite motif-containing protein 71